MKALCKILCCLTNTAIVAEKAARSPTLPCCCCCCIKCNIDIKSCLDQCTAEVTPENDVQMTGQDAPSAVTMS